LYHPLQIGRAGTEDLLDLSKAGSLSSPEFINPLAAITVAKGLLENEDKWRKIYQN
jgi:hypothetical protein